MAREVIDLVSDSDEASPRKSASSTLQAFVPRKEKVASKAPGHAQPAANAAQRAKPPVNQGPSQQSSRNSLPTTNALQDLPANASIAEILKHGAQQGGQNGFAQKTGHINTQQPATPRQATVGTKNPFPRNNTGRLSGGPLAEERYRRFHQFHQKEAERRGEKEALQGSGLAAYAKAAASKAAEAVTAASRSKEAQVFPTNAAVSSEVPKRRHPSPAQDPRPQPKRHKQGVGASDKRIQREAPADAIVPSLPANELPNPKLSSLARDPRPRPTRHNTIDRLQHTEKAEIDTVELISKSEPERKIPSPAQNPRPQAKRHKTQHKSEGNEEAEVNDGVQEARRVSAAAITPLSTGLPRPSRDITASAATPGAQRVTHLESIDLTKEESDHEESGSINAIERESSPDEIPARPITNAATTKGGATQPGPQRPIGSFQKATQVNAAVIHASSSSTPSGSAGNFGTRYTKEEDEMLIYLKEQRNIGWEAMPSHFSGRTQGSLKVRYSGLKSKAAAKARMKPTVASRFSSSLPRYESEEQPQYSAPARRQPKLASRNDGFVSWAEIKGKRPVEESNVIPGIQKSRELTPAVQLSSLERSQRPSPARILRNRELGKGLRSHSSTRLQLSEDLQNHVLDTFGPRRMFHGASRDVTCVAWACDGNRFAAGAIAIDDERSMQYNRPNNLLLGNLEGNSLKELPEHHVPRPAIFDPQNVNSLHTMQETQDSRLFKTVAAVNFSEDGNALYTAGGEGVVRMYDSLSGDCVSSFNQGAEVALLSTNSRGLLAAGCHRSDDSSISILRCEGDAGSGFSAFADTGPSRTDVQSSLPIFPSALRWGAGMYSHLLLAGFSSDSFEEDRNAAGEICLWDSTVGQKLELPTARNVFDVAWNPSPSSSASLFAVAGAQSSKRNRTSVECFAPNQGRASRVLQWDCPAFDINDVLYCPHDDNLIAAGATDGKVYIWDKRFASRNQSPLHALAHGKTENILDPARDIEIADTGVRFLSWSATRNRLYSGSSDGTVKIWDPYRQDPFVKDVATFNSAVMSGAFSPDYRDLLIGEDQGQLNLLGIDREGRSVRAAKKFDHYPAPVPLCEDEDKFAQARQLVYSGKIEIRPMGVLPVKQAVQGPNYQSSCPSEDDMDRLAAEYQSALQIRAQTTLLTSDSDLKAAEARVKSTQEAVHQAQRKINESRFLGTEATQLQKALRETRHAWKKEMSANAVERCKLDCNYLPAAGDEDGEAPDDYRSEQRIPDKLRAQRRRHLPLDADMTDAEVAELGLTRKCSACMAPAPKPKRGLPKCDKCTLVASGLTARCSNCASPIRPDLDQHAQPTTGKLCQRCNFKCFRCGHPASLSPDCEIVTCEPCGAVWEAGALGYELISHKPKKRIHEHYHERAMESLEQRMGRLFGDSERERLARG